MKNPPKAIFPGILVGVLFLVFFTGLLTANQSVQASILPTVDPIQPTSPLIQKAAPASSDPATNATCSLPSRYPETIRRWCSLIEQAADKNGLEPRLIASVMLQESGGNAKAYSKSGAIGLMQIMPRDGIAASFQCINGPCFAARPSMAELSDPKVNLDYGAKMLSGLIKKLGSVREALRAYGPMDMAYAYADKVLAIYASYK